MPRSNYKTQHSREYVYLRLVVALVAVGALLFISSASVKAAWSMYQTFDVAAAESAVAERELAALTSEHEAMAATLAQFETERGVEAALRERFGVVRPGEGEIRIVRDTSVSVGEVQNEGSPFSRLFHALFAW